MFRISIFFLQSQKKKKINKSLIIFEVLMEEFLGIKH